MRLPSYTPKQWGSVACSGATTSDVHSQGYGFLYGGQSRGGAPLSGNGHVPRLEGYPNREYLQMTALNEMIPGRVEQIKFVEKHKPKIITLTVGANDIGFGDKLMDCMTVGTCDWATNKKSSLASQIQGQYDSLRSLYQELYRASDSQAKIFVLGYPHLVSGSASAQSQCKHILSLNSDERLMIRQATDYLNQVIEHAANAAGAKYVDISNALDGDRLCEGTQQYVTALAWRGDSEVQETFHPNASGHIRIAQEVRMQLGNSTLSDYEICENGRPSCPQTGSFAEKPPIPVELGGTPARSSQNSQITPKRLIKGATFPVSLNPFILQPNSILQVELHSDPVSLGQFITGKYGELDGQITIPSSVPAGYHTLVITSETYSGEPTELTQTVLVTGSNPEDLDEDGVPDMQQPCGPFVQASGFDTNSNGIDDACDPQADQEPQLYRVRLGDAARMHNGTPEQDHFLYIERNTRAHTITGIVDEYDPDGDGWSIVGVSRGLPYTASSVPDTGPAANFEVSGEGASAKPYVYTRAGGYGCASFTPSSLAKVQPGQDRVLKRVAVNTGKCRYDSTLEDLDLNGIPDHEQPLYFARNGDQAKGENPSRVYLFRSFHAAEAQLGISDYNPTGTAGNTIAALSLIPSITDPPNHPLFGRAFEPIQPWNLLSVSRANEYIPTFNRLAILDPEHPDNNTNSPLPIILTKKLNGQCIAYKPQATTIIKFNQNNILVKLPNIPEGESCE